MSRNLPRFKQMMLNAPSRLMTILFLLVGTVGLQAQLNVSFSVEEPICFGLPNGSVTATATGGTAPYTYMWSTGHIGAELDGITAGVYSVTVTDAASQMTSANVTVNQPDLITVTLTADDLCAAPFTITANPDGGIAPYQYNWSTGAMTQTIVNVPVGSYCVTVTDSNSCGAVECITVDANPPSVNVSTGNVTCPNGSDGTLTAIPTPGQPPYSYLWSNGATTQVVTNVPAGFYTVTLTDANGCTATASGTVSQPPPIVINLNGNNPTCAGDTNGSVTSSVSGGTPPYTYSWSSGQNSPNIFNLGPGTYILTVTDANGCVQIASVTLVYASNLVVGGVGTPETCPDFNDGFATVSASGGVFPYSYLWNTGAVTQVISGVAPGTYSVTVTDAVGCTGSTVITVAAAPDFTATATSTDVTTCGVSNGTATAIVTAGVGPFTYAWSNGGTTQTILNLAAGTYSVTITNGDGCQTTASTSLVAPPDVFVNAMATPLVCPGEATGSATANVTGGTPPFTYSWSNGGNTQTITGLVPGVYTVIVTDANGCTASDVVSINQAPGVTVNVSGTPVVCGVGATGTALATPLSGTPPFSYSWSNGATTAQVIGLTEGTYTVVVTDANGCTGSGSISIDIVDDLVVSINSTDIPCFGQASGTATAIPSGGTAPYTFAWSNGANTQSIGNLVAGTYSVVITDANGCTATNIVTISQPTDLTASIEATNPLNCFGESDASLTVVAMGGTPAYTYLWSTGETTASISGLPAGTYSVTVTDANGCTETASFTVSQTQQILVSIDAETVICGAENSGDASATAVGGTAPYTYTWNNGATSESIDNLPSGTYAVTVTDALGCTGQAEVTITIISDFAVSVIPRDVLCTDGNSGSVLAVVNGGTMPYTYMWNNGATTNEIVGLSAGTYSLTVSDANGCILSETVSIGEPPVLTANISSNNPDCFNEASGTATVTVAGGTLPYLYQWSNGANAPANLGLTAGTYTVTITDANLCTTTASVTLTAPEELVVNISAPTIQCGGTATGIATAIVTGGTPPYSYLWSDGQITQSAMDLMAGTYTVTVTDANGCSSVIDGIVLNELPAIEVDLSVVNIDCSNAAIGSITATPSMGTPPYTYQWDSGQTTQTINNLSAGTYTVTVTDVNGCKATVSETVTQTAGLTVDGSGTNVLCFGGSDGTATATVNGGTAPFTYIWSNGGTTATITGLAAGSYGVTVTDANECTGTTSVTVSEPTELTVSASGSDLDCADMNDGTATASPSGGTPPYSYSWSNGATTQTATGLSAGTYTVTVTDDNGCTAMTSVTISSPNGLSVLITQNSGTCNNQTDGILAANVTGGTGPYTYAWSNGATTQAASNLAAGTYSVTVTDANGCTASSTAGLTIFPAPTCSVSVDAESTLGNNGQLTVTPAGGTLPYTYIWNSGQTTQTISGLAPGTYTVTVTDANGCQTTCSGTLDALAGLGNYVWEDIDHDGLQDDDEPVVPGVTVNLKDAGGNIIATTVTDANGEYYFLGLDPGTYSVQFEIPAGFDYTINDNGDDALDSDIQPGMNGMTNTITLTAGELDFTLDGGIYVPPNGIIADPCICLNNSTTENNGQFLEEFTVFSYPNEVWTVIEGSGMYDLASPAPPAAPLLVAFPQTMTEVNPGEYKFPFLLVDEITYTVVVTNGFDTLSITNTCEYPILNINELPPTELCLIDAPIELGANPSIPGNLIFTINGDVVTDIDPAELQEGSYELVATLVPLDPEECEATIVTQFSVIDDCLAEVGDFVWLDLDCDGIQGGNEPGVPGIMVIISGNPVEEFDMPTLVDTTFTDGNGNYSFMVPPGTYKLTFPDLPGYDISTPNQGGNDLVDSDVYPGTLMTDMFTLEAYEQDLSWDLGLCPPCINVEYPGAIGYNQYLCAPGNDPEPFVSLAAPTGGTGNPEYLWMMTTGDPEVDIQFWTPIPNSDSPTYDAGPLFETTYYARCVRNEGCTLYLESNVLVVEVGDEANATILGPNLVCYNQLTTFSAAGASPGAQVTWNFGGNASPSTATGHTVSVLWSTFGSFTVELIVTEDNCTAYDYQNVTITSSPTLCNSGLQIDADVIDEATGGIKVSWEMPSYVPLMNYHVEHSADGENFTRVSTVTEVAQTLNGINYFVYEGVTPKKGRNFYRVEVEDALGNVIFSNIEEVIIFTDSRLAMLYPNPVEDQLTLEIFDSFDEDVTLQLFTASGQLLTTIPVEAGTSTQLLNLARYPAGAYFIRLRFGQTNVKTMRFIKR